MAVDRQPFLARAAAQPGASPKAEAGDGRFEQDVDGYISPSGASTASVWLPTQCAPVIQAARPKLVEFLGQGHAYDNVSVSEAVQAANRLFDARDVSAAFDAYGVAYEIARLSFDYRPLLYDALIRRAMCQSMLGDVVMALEELTLAEKVVPHEPTTHLLRGLFHLKLGSPQIASHCLQQAVIRNCELQGFVECLIGLFWLRRGECDKALKTSSRVLGREPQYRLALLLRSGAHKAHASGHFERQAEADLAAAAAAGPGGGLPARVGRFGPVDQVDAPLRDCQLDEVMLHFHHDFQGPRSYEEYPMYVGFRKRQNFTVVSCVVLFVVKMKGNLRSTREARKAAESKEKLLLRRVHAEVKLMELLSGCKAAPVLEGDCTTVWGPADASHLHAKKHRRAPPHAQRLRARQYRRHWLERPAGFPRRRTETSTDSFEDPLAGASSILEPEIPRAAWSDQGQARTTDSSPADHTRPSQSGGLSPDGAGDVDATLRVPEPTPVDESSQGRQPPQGSSPSAPAPRAAWWSSAQEPGGCRPWPSAAASSSPNEPSARATEAAPPGSSPAPAGPPPVAGEDALPPMPPPPPRMGAGWSESDWLERALSLIDEHGGAGRLDDDLGTADVRQPPEAEPCVSNDVTTVVSLPKTRALDEYEEVNLVQAVAQHGWDALPDWYPNLDRIYDLSCMIDVRTKPERMAPGYGLAGDASCSFAVPRVEKTASRGNVFALQKEKISEARAASRSRGERRQSFS